MADEATQVSLTLPPELAAGVFADMAIVWHNEHGFTLDFVAQSGPEQPASDVRTGQIVARVRIPPSVIFQVARVIADNVSKYEQAHGPIRSGGPNHTPDEG